MIRTGYLGLGSNVGDRRAHLRAAIDALPGAGVRVLAASSVYETEPVGEVLDQPEFYNACLRVETTLEPEALLDACKGVERRVGRAPGGRRHAPRSIDVDLLLLGDREHRSERLTLPHREVRSRRFVLVPLLELDPHLRIPGGPSAAQALAALEPGQAVRRVLPPLEVRRGTCPGNRATAMASDHTSRRMLLVVDAGNTQTHIGTFQGPELVEHWRFATVRESTADELGAVLRNLLSLRGLVLEDIDASIVSSTVPQLRPEWTRVASRYLGHEMPAVGPGVRTGMPLRFDSPREIGPDRLVNAVAGYDLVGGACVVVDFGTAVTFDVVSEDGEYLGGIIFPGVEISLEALSERAAALPKIDLGEPRALIGKTTVDAVRSGVVYGFAAMVDGMIGRLRDEMGEATEAIATGGLAASIVPYCRTIAYVDDLLTLTGLRLIWERNQA